MRLLLAVVVLLSLITIESFSQKQYKTAKEAIAALYDFNESDGGLKVTKDGDAPELILSQNVSEKESSQNIQTILKQICVYGVFRTFIHTNAKSVKITAQTRVSKTSKITKKLNISVTREKALKCIQTLLGASKFAELVKATQYVDSKSVKFENGYYPDKKPGLDAVFNFLSK